jgi:cytochrome c oxidase subunit 2
MQLSILSRPGIAVASVAIVSLALAGTLLSCHKRSASKYALEVTVIGHQYWWEIRYPQLGIVTANELHIPAGETTSLTMTSADVEHSFVMPGLALKADAEPNDMSTAWVTPETTGIYVGQCARKCRPQDAKMLFRAYIEAPSDFRTWAAHQRTAAVNDENLAQGKAIFEHLACVSCHTIAGTVARGTFGPDLTHVAGRDTIVSGSLANTPQNLRAFIDNPALLKPGCLMPSMRLNPHDLNAVTAYIASLK